MNIPFCGIERKPHGNYIEINAIGAIIRWIVVPMDFIHSNEMLAI